MFIRSYFTEVIKYLHVFVYGALNFLLLDSSDDGLSTALNDENCLYFKSLLDVFELSLKLYITTTKQDFIQTMNLFKKLYSYYDIQRFKRKRDILSNIIVVEEILIHKYEMKQDFNMDSFLIKMKSLKNLCIEFDALIVSFNHLVYYILQEKYEIKMTSF